MNVNVSFKMTEKAVKEIKKVMEESNIKNQYLRVSVRGGGCSGFMYGLGFEENTDENLDLVENFDGINVVIDRKSVLFLDGVTLDWTDELDQRGFKFNNPNATKTCGCGKSFQ